MRPTGSQEAAGCDDSSDVELISPSPATCDVRDLQDGSAVDQVLLVREREIRRTRAGADYMRLALADRTGIVLAVVWDDVEEAAAAAAAGEPVRVIGSFAEHPRYGRQITVHSLARPGRDRMGAATRRARDSDRGARAQARRTHRGLSAIPTSPL